MDAFSVAFLPVDVKMEMRDGKKVQLLNDVKLLNVALTGNPCNTKAQLYDVVSKSMNALEEYKKAKEKDPSIEGNLVVKSKKDYDELLKDYDDLLGKHVALKENKSNSSLKGSETDIVSNNQLNTNTSLKNMTEKPNEQTSGKPEENESGDVEQKAILKDISASLKSMNEKYDAVIKDNETMKESVAANAETLAKVVKALEQPIRKSQGALTAEELAIKAQVGQKSVDPLELCF